MATPFVMAGPSGQLASDPSDAELVQHAKSGDRSAVVALYQRYVREIYGYAYNQMGVVEEAEDLTSEIFLRFVRSIESFRGQASVRTWLYAIARNCLRDRWRTSGRRPNVVSLDHAVAAADTGIDSEFDERLSLPVENASSTHATLLGAAILRELPPRYRRVLELRVMEGRSIQDSAEAMATTPGNVKVLQHRALKRAIRVADELGLSPRPLPVGAQQALRSET